MYCKPLSPSVCSRYRVALQVGKVTTRKDARIIFWQSWLCCRVWPDIKMAMKEVALFWSFLDTRFYYFHVSLILERTCTCGREEPTKILLNLHFILPLEHVWYWLKLFNNNNNNILKLASSYTCEYHVPFTHIIVTWSIARCHSTDSGTSVTLGSPTASHCCVWFFRWNNVCCVVVFLDERQGNLGHGKNGSPPRGPGESLAQVAWSSRCRQSTKDCSDGTSPSGRSQVSGRVDKKATKQQVKEVERSKCLRRSQWTLRLTYHFLTVWPLVTFY